MSVTELIDKVLGRDTGGPERKTYECADCGETFETMKSNESRISCPECLSHDVDRGGTTE